MCFRFWRSIRRDRPPCTQALCIGSERLAAQGSFQEQVHQLCCKQLPIQGWRNWVELPHVICPGELDFKPTASTIVTKAADLNIIHGLRVMFSGSTQCTQSQTHFQQPAHQWK
jgi:hypothetical protein